MPKIVDPDDLIRGTSVIFDITDTEARTAQIVDSLADPTSLIPPLTSGSDSGVTGQALYSFFKEQWKSQNDLIRIPFPLISITKTQFDWTNNWNYDTDVSRLATRDAGWSVISASIVTEEWVGIVSLGTISGSEQVYYQQGNELSQSVNFAMSGTVNQAIKQFSQSHVQEEFNSRGYTKIFVREYQKTYDDASIQDDLAVPTQEYVVYSLPLTNAPDLKIATTVESDATGAPYNEVTIAYLSGSGFGQWAIQTYPAGAVVQDSLSGSQWFITNAGGTSTNTGVADDAGVTDWLVWDSDQGGGQRLIGTEYYPFIVIVDAGVGKNNSIAELYTRVQYELRLDSDIDDGTQVVDVKTGKTTDLLLRFLGDTLITSDGVFVDNFTDADTNSIDFYDVSGTVRRFPFVSAGTINFNDNLSADLTAEYYMFFTSVPSGTYGSASAVIVDDNDTIPITGSVSGSSSVAFTFDYDSNVQGGRTEATDAPVTVVAIGLNTAQYVVATSTIARSKVNSVSLVAALERNYNNPA